MNVYIFSGVKEVEFVEGGGCVTGGSGLERFRSGDSSDKAVVVTDGLPFVGKSSCMLCCLARGTVSEAIDD